MLALVSSGAAGENPVPQDHYRNWYEIFVYSYQDSNGDGIGDLNGLYNRLDYISDMGYTGLWLMPVMPSPSYHKYDVTDYYNIDPQYGTVEDFKRLVERCHDLGIAVIIDMPINHTSTNHPWFQEACRALKTGNTENPYIDYYCFQQKPSNKHVNVSGTEWYYEEQFAGGNMPDLNLDNPSVMAEFEKIFAFWLQECGADGFRLDAVTSYFASNTEKNIEKLNEIKALAEAARPGSYLVGEAWTGLNVIAEYYASDLDSFFLFPASQAEGYVAKSLFGRSPASAYVKNLKLVYEAIPDGILAPFMSNHDTGRTIPAIQGRGNPEKAKFTEGILNMIGGATFTYYGEEIGMVGAGEDPNKRIAMYWNDADMTQNPPGVTKVEYAYPSVDEQLADEQSLLHYCRGLNHTKLQIPAIARGKTEFLYNNSNVCLMKREWEEDTIYIAINFSSAKPQTLALDDLDVSIIADLETGMEKAEILTDENGRYLQMPSYAIVIMAN